MNTASIIVLAIVFVLAALAVRRVMKKGAPCECGGSSRTCSRSGGCSRCSCC